METHAPPSQSPTDELSPTRAKIAPIWHTIGFVAIFIGIAVLGGFFQHVVSQHPQTVPQNASAIPRYISVIVFEWLLVLYVRWGIRKRGVSLRDLISGRWATSIDILRDLALGGILWAVWIGIERLSLFGHAPNTAEGLLPKGILESLVWIPVALSAGFCEELAFRGYLQKQVQTIAGSALVAVFLQGFLFGIGHLYEGPQAVVKIVLYGVLFGLLAMWRRSLRPGMIAHVWSDIAGVIFLRGL
jgi:uncharacterized protein